MAIKYRFKYEEFDHFYKIENGKCQRKDDMLWEYDNIIIGISKTKDYFVMNHYGKSFDKSEYVMADDSYSLDTHINNWCDFYFADWDIISDCEKVNV